MRKKGKLGKTRIFIELDMIFEERKVQSELRKRVKEEREKGGRVVVKYQKIKIEDT